MLSNLVLGRLGDRHGPLLAMRLATVSAALPPLSALLIACLPLGGAVKIVLFGSVFVFQGIYTTANMIGSTTYLLALDASAERVLYIGFAHSVLGVAMFTSPLGGALVDWVGFVPLFVVSLAGGLLAVMLSLGLAPTQDA